MYFYITFRSPKKRDTKTLRWILKNNPVTHIWMRLVKKSGKINVEQLSFPSSVDKLVISKKLESAVEALNNLGANLPVWETTEKIDQDRLNLLHESFHKFEDRVENRVDKSGFIKKTTEVKILFEEVNKNVHILEGFRHSDDGSGKSHSYAVCRPERFDLENVSMITEDLRKKYFLNGREINSNIPCIYLGYATIGKNLSHCHADKDTSIIKQRLLSPQEYITTEFCISLNSHKKALEDYVSLEDKHDVKTEEMRQWIIENNLESYVDLTDPKIIYSGEPLLGVMEKTMSSEELYLLLSGIEYKIKEHGFIVNGTVTKFKYTS